MDALATQRSISDTDESLELPIPEGTLRFGSESELCNYIESTAEKTPRRKIRVSGRSNRQIDKVAKPAPASSCEDNKMGNQKIVAERLDDFLDVGSTTIADLDNLITQLQDARDYLQAESERVRLANARYSHLAQTASASAKIIADSMGQWRNSSPVLSSSPVHEVQVQLEQKLSQS